MKICTNCNIEKDESGFYFRKITNNYTLRCKECILKSQKEYCINNKEKINERNRQYYKNNKEEINKKNKQYRDDNKEFLKEKQSQYRKNNKEEVKKSKKKYYENNKEEIKRDKRQERKENGEEVRERDKRYRTKNFKKQMFKRARQRAKENSLEFNITVDDIIVPEKCPILNILLSIGNKKREDNSPSIDRINNNKGYIRGNIIIVSWRANNLKSDASIDELEKLYLRI